MTDDIQQIRKQSREEFKAMIRKMGLQFWTRPDWDMTKQEFYGYVTDGTRICYVQQDRNPFSGWDVSSCHKPNTRTGTGYQVERGLDSVLPQHIEGAFAFHSANWASGADREATVKWRNWEEFQARDKWQRAYVRVEL